MRYYVTTGKSLSTHARCWKNGGKSLRDATHDKERSREGLYNSLGGRSYLQAHKSLVENNLLAKMNDESRFEDKSKELIEEYFDEECWSDDLGYLLPAELCTLRLMDKAAECRPSENACHEVIFLIGSALHLDGKPGNAREGHLCCAMFQKLVDSGKTKNFNGCKVSLISGLKWDPLLPDTFRATSENLVEELRVPCNFVLTGGYKGTLLGIAISAALKMRKRGWIELLDPQLGESRWKPQIYYLSEDNADELIRLSLTGFFGEAEGLQGKR